MTTREEKIKEIYNTIGCNKQIHDLMDGIAGYNYRTCYLLGGDVIQWLGRQYGEYSLTIRGDGSIDLGGGPLKIDMSVVLEKQSDDFIDYVYSLIESDK